MAQLGELGDGEGVHNVGVGWEVRDCWDGVFDWLGGGGLAGDDAPLHLGVSICLKLDVME